MKKRKIILGLLFASMIMGISSCRKDDPEPEDPKDEDITTPDDPSKDDSNSDNPKDDTPKLDGDVGTQGEVQILKASGHLESAYVEWSPVQDATTYHVYYKKQNEDDSKYSKVSDMLIRKYTDKYRVDVVGLAEGDYEIKIVPVVQDTEKSFYSTVKMKVIPHDRSGYAFDSTSLWKEASGAYNADGTLKSGAQVIYVTANNAKTVEATIGGVKVKGFQSILDAKQKKGNKDILDIRIIGEIKKTNLDHISSSSEGLQIKGAEKYQNMNLTIEGIGEDATINGFGILIRNCGNVEIRNLGIINFMDDGVSIDTDNRNLWVHNLDIFYGNAGGDSDQVKGDGSLDCKKSKYCTFSYNHFWDSGKSCLLDASDGTGDAASDYITYHHNWFDHSDSRHPRVRNAGHVHVYNNYYDGNAKYGVGSTTGSSTFVEANYFRNCKYPMMISLQGSDALGAGTFSGETGGMIKAYGNHIEGASSFLPYSQNQSQFDCYDVSSRNETVDENIKNASGFSYNNFDTEDGFYTYAVDSAEVGKDKVEAFAGRINGGDLQWDFNDSVEDSNYEVISELKTKVTNYKTTLIKVLGDTVNDSEPGDTPGGSTPTTPSIEGTIVHNFTKDGKESSYFIITGNLSTSKGTQTYQGQTLTQCLKLESSTNITFTIQRSMTLVLVLGNGGNYIGQTIKVDDKKYTSNNEGVITVALTEGSHTITKADSSNIFLIALQEN